MKTNTEPSIDIIGLAHEIWAVAQLLPEEGIEDGVERVINMLKENLEPHITETLTPIAFRRLDDGEMFTLDPNGETYSNKYIKEKFPDSLTHGYKPYRFSPDLFEPVYEEEK